ncbi:hypothetical protein [Gemmatimonas sp.]
MIPHLTHDDVAILSAQLAFIRSERRTQRRQPRLFATPTGAPLPRQRELTRLCDRVADLLLQLVQADPQWCAHWAGPGPNLPMSVALSVAERVARYGQGLPSVEVEEMAAPMDDPIPVLVGAPDPDPFALLRSTLDAHGELRWWPRGLPYSVAREALRDEVADVP